MLTLSSKGLSLFEQCSSCIDQFEYSLIRHIEPEQLALVKATLELVLKQLQDSKEVQYERQCSLMDPKFYSGQCY